MSLKTERLEVRVDAATKERIEAAAARLDQSASTFVVHAASAEADRVLARSENTIMPAEQFDALLAALDIPDDAPVLTRLVQRDRKYHRP
ncbi:MAG: type II toxin-antitoxin system TacA family antitoxin [Pseudonocardiales bacterium]